MANTPNCTGFCTAAKCQELETKINALENIINSLKEAFNAHTSENIPTAHNYNPVVSINTSAFDGSLTIEVDIDGNKGTDTVGLPPPIFNQLSVNASIENKDLTIDVSIDGKSDSGTVSLPTVENVILDGSILDGILNLNIDIDNITDYVELNLPEIPEIPETSVTLDISNTENGDYLFKINVNDKEAEDILSIKDSDLFNTKLEGSASFKDDILTINISDGKSEDSFEVSIPISDLEVDSELEIDGVFKDGKLVLTIGDGNSEDTLSLKLPEYLLPPEEEEYILSNLKGIATYKEEILEISISDGESVTVFEVEINGMDDLTKEKIDKIYQILGGDNWATSSNGNVSMPVKPEKLINTVGKTLYSSNSNTLTELTVTNLLELMTVFSTVDFFRSGHHRLPATVVSSLRNTEEGNVPMQIYDAFSYQVWLGNQIDDLVGEFPVKMKFKTTNDSGGEVEKDVCLENISEAIAEFFPLLINIAEDSDTAINIGMKNLVEAMKASNAAITTYDYAVANAQYLGYRGNEKEREIDLTFTPGAKNMREVLQPSKKKIVGWKNEDDSTLIEIIKRTLIATEIVKASVFHPFSPGDSIAGDAIKENLEQQKTDDETNWEEFQQKINNPTGKYSVPKPKAKLKDFTIDIPEL